MKYRISEIFYSIQGEGFNAGQPSIFIRLAGCSMNCSFCDTKYALRNSKELTVEEIFNEVSKFNCKNITITGGEPFEQDLTELIDKLSKTYKIHLETNGSIVKDYTGWITVSPKKYVDKFMLLRANEVKIVIGRNSFDEKKVKEILKQVSMNCKIYVQPESNKKGNIKKCLQIIKKNAGLSLSIQIHKLIDIK